jgi:hypothetical protein
MSPKGVTLRNFDFVGFSVWAEVFEVRKWDELRFHDVPKFINTGSGIPISIERDA